VCRVNSKKSKTEEALIVNPEKKQEEAKKKAEDIWAAFKKDTDFIISKPTSSPKTVVEEGPSLVSEKQQPSKQISDKKEEPKIFEFAGETLV
jgi:glucan-binding YG repeat protein